GQPPGRGGGCPPPLPQIRTCPFKASGSSGHGLACAVLPDGVKGTRRPGAVSWTGCPPPAPPPAAPSLHGVPTQRFPRFPGTMRHSDSLNVVSANSLWGVADRYLPVRLFSSLPPGPNAGLGAWGTWGTAAPGPQLIERERQGLSSSQATLVCL